jgi:D-lactate dehydrogenase
MKLVIELAHQYNIHLGFRAAGTSLSGQALTDGVLIIQGKGWRSLEILDQGNLVKCQPGLRGSEVNARLKAYQRKIGPDPASIDSAKIGGIAANNASGMCCGTQHNSYQTLHSLRCITSDGHLLDTSNLESREAFAKKNSLLLKELMSIAEYIRCQPELVELIEQKYLLKNTTGYAMNAFLDYHDPIDLLSHLLIGSEGTLAFISEITYRTVQEDPCKSNALIFFKNAEEACHAVTQLKNSPAKAIELMDYQALLSVKNQLPSHFIERDGCTALLIDLHAQSPSLLLEKQKLTSELLASFQVHLVFTDHVKNYAHLWKIRKGMFPSVAAMRQQGETVIIEDVAVPLQHLAEATSNIQDLFKKNQIYNAIIFGHAKEGNLHIVFNQSFQNQSEIKRYGQLMDDLCHLITQKFKGSLKAEHGTGRNMAPYVEQEWGPKIYQLMQRIKKLFDPKNLLNPNVIITRDSKLHLKNLKPIPQTLPEIDNCMECGFCERVCPSKDLTLTPRQRIVALREMQLFPKNFNLSHQTSLLQFEYRGNQTCATDSMCAEACPVGIDTGKAIKSLRHSKRNALHKLLAQSISKHQNKLETLSRFALVNYHILKPLFKLLPIPLPGALPQAAKSLSLTSISSPEKVVLFSSCMNRVFDSHLLTALFSLTKKSGIEIIHVNQSGSCCGLPYASKGFQETAKDKHHQVMQELMKASEAGKITIISDNSPCTQQLNQFKQAGLTIQDCTTWLVKTVLPKLKLTKLKEPLALHLTCSSQKMNLAQDLITLANRLSDEIIQPEGVECCGFAGDRGFTNPELNQSALRNLKKQLPKSCKTGVSNSRTCEIGLSWHSDREFIHIATLLDQQSTGR